MICASVSFLLTELVPPFIPLALQAQLALKDARIAALEKQLHQVDPTEQQPPSSAIDRPPTGLVNI